MKTDTEANKKLISLITELYMGGKKLNISLVSVSQSYFKVPKDIRLNAWYEEGYELPPFSLSKLHMIPQNNPNGKMDEGYI